MAVVRYIVREKNRRPLELQGTVAVIGNSDLLDGSTRGPEIDSFDHVFRFNLASVEPRYQPAVGSKTDFFLLSQNITTHQFPHNKELYMRFVSHCRSADIICYPGHTKNVRKFNKKPYVMTLTPDDANRVFLKTLSLLPVQFSLRNHPRNGIKLLACLLDAGIKPALFGFDLSRREANTHYFDNEIQQELPSGGHMPSWEYALLNELREIDAIAVY